ncbi:hypothetical protein [Pseudonocardia endophytica]|uniref:Uncharacterized protein n=1 Tax=Pseudonocardia endophytica TaxID=401976 RepID=A0A4R1IAU9_PSEEN|nr:hypothetical protein [Pseudonocardia endophytica]TCK27502.1 hypothetical protein EV378_3374 [Pseudonocardia endophytica]
MTEPTGESREPDDGLDETLDALEEKVLGKRADQTRDEQEDGPPAFEQDADAGDEQAPGSGSEPP